MPQYYAIERSGTYLAHYGVKGMKWGVRKALARGSERALDRQYRKASRKLNKLTKLGMNKDKFKKKAAAYGAGAAALGGLATAGTSGVGNLVGELARRSAMRKVNTAALLRRLSNGQILSGTEQSKYVSNLADTLAKRGSRQSLKGSQAKEAIQKWGNTALKNKTVSEIVNNTPVYKNGKRVGWTSEVVTTVSPDTSSVLGKINRNQVLRVGAGLGAAGLGAAAIRNAYRAKTADRNMIRAAQFKQAMNEAFAGTKYANGGANKKRKRRI